MNILIMSYREALQHFPEQATYAIRIGSSYRVRDRMPFDSLRNSPLYRVVNEYFFDYANPREVNPGIILFNTEIAEKMLKDFIGGRKKCKELMVHCSYGLNRSPAVAMAFNEIFNLGEDTFRLSKLYPEFDNFVFNSLIENASRLKII
jgi:hypothetical protein